MDNDFTTEKVLTPAPVAAPVAAPTQKITVYLSAGMNLRTIDKATGQTTTTQLRAGANLVEPAVTESREWDLFVKKLIVAPPASLNPLAANRSQSFAPAPATSAADITTGPLATMSPAAQAAALTIAARRASAEQQAATEDATRREAAASEREGKEGVTTVDAKGEALPATVAAKPAVAGEAMATSALGVETNAGNVANEGAAVKPESEKTPAQKLADAEKDAERGKENNEAAQARAAQIARGGKAAPKAAVSDVIKSKLDSAVIATKA